MYRIMAMTKISGKENTELLFPSPQKFNKLIRALLGEEELEDNIVSIRSNEYKAEISVDSLLALYREDYDIPADYKMVLLVSFEDSKVLKLSVNGSKRSTLCLNKLSILVGKPPTNMIVTINQDLHLEAYIKHYCKITGVIVEKGH